MAIEIFQYYDPSKDSPNKADITDLAVSQQVKFALRRPVLTKYGH